MSENEGISSLALNSSEVKCDDRSRRFSVSKNNFQTYYEHFSITISSELLMSETLVPTFFLEFFFTKEKASCKAATESRETVRRESPLADLFILQTIFFPGGEGQNLPK